MSCLHHNNQFEGISPTGECIMNFDHLPKYMEEQHWQRYRLEYGFECGCPEGTIYLPPWVDIDEVVDYLNKHIKDGPTKPPKSD